MCFRQGKACVYASEEDGTIIIAAPPGGVIERLDTGADEITDSLPTVANANDTGHQPLIPQMTIVIGGNGAGKTTWCRQHPRELPEAFYNPDAIAQDIGDWNNAGNQLEAGRIVNAAIRRHLEQREAFGVSRAPIRDVPGRGSYARQPRTGTPSGRCSLAPTEPRSTSSACVNASGRAPDTTSRCRRSGGGGQQLRRTLPKRLRRSERSTCSTTATAKPDTSHASRGAKSGYRRRQRPRGRER